MAIIIAYSILLFFLLFSLMALIISSSIILGLIMAKGVPFISIPRADWLKMCEAAELKPGQIVYDLGCGKANLLTTAAKNFGVKGIGYEISLWPYVWGRIRVWLQKADVQIRMKNFFQADISKADVVFCYLFPQIMDKLEPKFRSELKSGAKVVSYAFTLPNIQPAKVISATPRYSFFTHKPRYTSVINVYQF
ncbi:MAG: hypothetical protein WCT26_00675 [Candidatus Buchananbacteria bacterium]|jgi:hypothetical protein